MTLTDFLLARIAEDEAASVNWTCDCALEGLPLEHGWSCRERVLAECEAKRRIAALHFDRNGEEKASGDPEDTYLLPSYCGCCNDGQDYWKDSQWPCSTLRLLVLPFATHPDFDPAWSVTAATESGT